MTWQEACAKSKTNRAVRYGNYGGKVIRRSDGVAIVQINPHHSRFAIPMEVEGHDDWKPEEKEE